MIEDQLLQIALYTQAIAHACYHTNAHMHIKQIHEIKVEAPSLRAQDIAQMMECLPCTHGALGLLLGSLVVL